MQDTAVKKLLSNDVLAVFMRFADWIRQKFKTESTRKSSNIYLRWTKIEYENNLNPIALFSTLNKR